MIRWFLCIGAVLTSFQSWSQADNALTIEECYSLAKQNYPLAKQKELIAKSKDYNLSNAAKGYLPQAGIYGSATLQSDVTQIPVKIPGMTIEAPGKDQYKVYGEITQTVWDWGAINQQKKLLETNSEVDNQKLDVELYKLKERINQLFFGILLLDAQMNLAGLLISDLQSAIKKTEAAVSNGIALPSSADALRAELLKAEQKAIELKYAKSGFSEMLGMFINRPMDDKTILVKPEIKLPKIDISRPEISLLESQKKIFDAQAKLLNAKNLPRIGIFVQGGYGRPALNMLNNEWDAYYIGGIRFSWPLTGFYTLRREKELLNINRSFLDVQKENFLFNTNLLLKQQNTEITKLEELIIKDEEIVQLRTGIKNTSSAQLENGTITVNDYIREVNAEDMAKQNLLLHRIQLIMAQYNYGVIAGD
ncbi:MAG: TolC family protein [Bacteroidetes bacterium]|nr:TolC family protein [Bacteroidota bacterium]